MAAAEAAPGLVDGALLTFPMNHAFIHRCIGVEGHVAENGNHRLVLGLVGLVAVGTLGLAWQASRNDTVARAADRSAQPQTLPPLAATVPSPPLAATEPEVELTTEQRRLKRYDKDADGAVDRDEYLTSRRKAYAKLDVNGDGTLSFDEYAVKTIEKFIKADADRNGELSSSEFSTTAQKRPLRKVQDCPPDDKKDD